MAKKNGTGIFPREVEQRPRSGFCHGPIPLLPLEEEGRLNDMPLRENFVEPVLAAQFATGKLHYRWTKMLDEEPTPGGLVKFHTAHKLTLMTHSPS